MNPEHYPRRILLAVTGLSPQVLTETLYALTQAESDCVNMCNTWQSSTSFASVAHLKIASVNSRDTCTNILNIRSR